MTFEEMQKIIEDMLSVQRELQESLLQLKERQVKFKERQIKFEERQLQLLKSAENKKNFLDELIPNYGDLVEHSIRQREILDCLITIQNSKFKITGEH
ncbi:MAG: hypothetical protein F6K21_38550 [Symploca sp. SIO2D2]|nr:hypothetical protein [Symploca sp. SIO2D2]